MRLTHYWGICQKLLSPFHGGAQWAEWGQFLVWWRHAGSSCAGRRAWSHGSSVYGARPLWGSSGAVGVENKTLDCCCMLLSIYKLYGQMFASKKTTTWPQGNKHTLLKTLCINCVCVWTDRIPNFTYIKQILIERTNVYALLTILRSLTTRVPPFLSPPTVLTTVALGLAWIFFSTWRRTNDHQNKWQRKSGMPLTIIKQFVWCQRSALTLVSVVLVFLLYMALRAYIADRE